MSGEVQEKMIEVVKRIPLGYVTRYGAVAKVVQEELGRRITPRIIGWQLSGLPEYQWNMLPWWRVVAKSGSISSLKLGDKGWKQIQLLEAEGIILNHYMVDMDIYACDVDVLYIAS